MDFSLQQHGQEHGLQGAGLGSIDSGLKMQAGQLKEPVQMGLVLPAQGPAELLPSWPRSASHT